jgi:hypothetical protein
MKTNACALALAITFFLAGLLTARAQPGYGCAGLFQGCSQLDCFQEGGECATNVSFNAYTTWILTYYGLCTPNMGICCQTVKTNVCQVEYYDIPAGETVCLAGYQVCGPGPNYITVAAACTSC